MVRKQYTPLHVKWLKESSNLFQNILTLFVLWLLAWAQNGLQTTGLVLRRWPMTCLCVIQTCGYVTAIGKPLPLKFCRTKKKKKIYQWQIYSHEYFWLDVDSILFFSLTFRVYVNVSIYLKVLYLKNSCNEKPIFFIFKYILSPE